MKDIYILRFLIKVVRLLSKKGDAYSHFIQQFKFKFKLQFNILTLPLSTAVVFCCCCCCCLTVCNVEYSSMGNHIVRKELITSHNPGKFLNTLNLFNKKPW